MVERTLLLSPHSDDIAMSAYGIVTKDLLPGPISLLTVFEWSNYMVLSERTFANLRTLAYSIPRPDELARSLSRNMGHFGKRPSKIMSKLFDLSQPYKVSRIRLHEDINFSKSVGVKFNYLFFPCSRCRHGTGITDPAWPLENEEEIIGKLKPVLEEMISRLDVQAIVSPWPYGKMQHIDHRLVNEIAMRIAEDTGTKLLYVDDQPYSRRPLDKMADRRGTTYSPTVVKLDPMEMKRKYSAMGIYRSQMTPGYLRAVRRPPPGSPNLSYSETLWLPN